MRAIEANPEGDCDGTGSATAHLFYAVPGGLDRWFDAVARARAEGTLDAATCTELARDVGLEWLE